MNFELIKRYELKENKSNKKIFFFHVPKCAGLSIANSLGVSLNHFRIPGVPYPRDKEFENNVVFVKKNIDLINKQFNLNLKHYLSSEIYKHTNDIQKKYSFLSGHLPFKEFHNDGNFFTFTIIRDPIERFISDYKFLLQKTKIDWPLETLIKKNIIQPNLMTSFFSSNKSPDITIAIDNLKKIDIVCGIDKIGMLLGYIISLYELPNIILTKINETKSKKNITDEELKLIIDCNQLDIKFYEEAKKIFFDFDSIEKKEIAFKYFSFYSPYKYFNNKNSLIFHEDKLDFVLNFLQKI